MGASLRSVLLFSRLLWTCPACLAASAASCLSAWSARLSFSMYWLEWCVLWWSLSLGAGLSLVKPADSAAGGAEPAWLGLGSG